MAATEFPDRLWLVATRIEEDAEFIEYSPVFDAREAADLPSRPYRADAGIDWERLARTRLHPTQIDIAELLSVDDGRALSPNEMAFELQEDLSAVSFHAKQLAEHGCLELVATEPRRGALEHFYRLAESPQ